MKSWITKEWTDGTKVDKQGRTRPIRFRAQVEVGKTSGVKPSDRFVVEWIDPTGKRCQEKIGGVGRPAKKAADERCQSLNHQLMGTGAGYKAIDLDTWEQVKARYIADVLPTKRSGRTVMEIKATLDRFEAIAKPHRMAGVTTSTIDRFVAERLKQTTRRGSPMRATTVNKDLRCLKGFFNKVKKWKCIPEVPEFAMLDETEVAKPIYTEAEFIAMYNACDVPTLPNDIGTCPMGQWWRTLLMLLWESGARIGETLSLEWSQLDIAKGCFIANPANTKSKRRKVYMFGDDARRLLRMLAEHSTGGLVFPWKHERSRLNDMLAEIQTKAGIDPKRADLKFHAFRRTVGDKTAELYGLTAAQHKLGHSSSAVTAKHYAPAAMRALAGKSAMPVPAELQNR